VTLLNASQIFVNFALGISALIGLSIFRGKTAEQKYHSRYPVEKINETFKLVDTEEAPDKIYLVDLKDKSKRWIKSSKTFLDLGFYWDQVVRITKKEFGSYTEKPGIFISGIPGR
jgi:hypothetical protein